MSLFIYVNHLAYWAGSNNHLVFYFLRGWSCKSIYVKSEANNNIQPQEKQISEAGHLRWYFLAIIDIF